MGQYYKVGVMQDGKIYGFDLAGWKLMESAWINNQDVAAIMALLMKSPAQVYWVGDYSDTIFEVAREGSEEDKKELPLYAHDEITVNLVEKFYKILWEEDRDLPLARDSHKFTFNPNGDYILVNNTKKEFIRWSRYKQECRDSEGYVVHPLPLLCATSNGLGGGDYHGINAELCGAWCEDVLSVCEESEHEVKRLTELMGYKESLIKFMED